jgi:hypothetical protein
MNRWFATTDENGVEEIEQAAHADVIFIAGHQTS